MKCVHKQVRYRRDAFSLIELIVVMSVSSVLLTLATVTIVRMQSLARSDNSRVESLATFVDLERQFRQDVHRADKATIDDDGLTLNGVSGAVRYQHVGDSVSRQVGDRFAMRSPLLGYEPKWQRDGTIVRLILIPTDDAANPQRRFDAALGLLANVSSETNEGGQ